MSIHKGMILIGVLIFTGKSVAEDNWDPTKPRDFKPKGQDSSEEYVEDAEGFGQQINLQALIVDEQRKIAVINGVFFKEGDKIGDKSIKLITSSLVELKSNKKDLDLKDEITMLKLPAVSIKKVENE